MTASATSDGVRAHCCDELRLLMLVTGNVWSYCGQP